MALENINIKTQFSDVLIRDKELLSLAKTVNSILLKIVIRYFLSVRHKIDFHVLFFILLILRSYVEVFQCHHYSQQNISIYHQNFLYSSSD